MTNEERDYIAPLIRSVFEELNKPFTEEDVERAIEKIDALSRETKLFNYSYKHPDYRSMVKEVPKQLIWLLDDMVEIDDVMDFEDILDKSVKMDRDTHHRDRVRRILRQKEGDRIQIAGGGCKRRRDRAGGRRRGAAL